MSNKEYTITGVALGENTRDTIKFKYQKRVAELLIEDLDKIIETIAYFKKEWFDVLMGASNAFFYDDVSDDYVEIKERNVEYSIL